MMEDLAKVGVTQSLFLFDVLRRNQDIEEKVDIRSARFSDLTVRKYRYLLMLMYKKRYSELVTEIIDLGGKEVK